MKTVTSDQMKRIDRLAQTRYGIPSIILMENAGRTSAEEILKSFSRLRRDPAPNAVSVRRSSSGSRRSSSRSTTFGIEFHPKKLHTGKKGKAAVFCGKGNNGGDGFVCARYLKQKGIDVDTFILGRCAEIKKKDPLTNLIILKKVGAHIIEIASKKDAENIKRNFHYDFTVDAIFGIGLKGNPPEEVKTVIDFLNSTRRPVYALDVPSGLDATTGKVYGTCIRAYKTITFGLPKTGLSRKEARPYIGRLVVKDIGLPRELLK